MVNLIFVCKKKYIGVRNIFQNMKKDIVLYIDYTIFLIQRNRANEVNWSFILIYQQQQKSKKENYKKGWSALE